MFIIYINKNVERYRPNHFNWRTHPQELPTFAKWAQHPRFHERTLQLYDPKRIYHWKQCY